MRSSFKPVLMCSALVAVCGLALAQPGTDTKKPPAPGNTAPAKPAAPAKPEAAKPAAPAGPEGMMDPKMMALMMPGPEHKKLDSMVGTFDAVCKFTMAPGAPEMTSKGTATNKWVLDGHFVEMTFTGDMMGQAFHGMGFMGYNNMSKQFESYWIDSMGTGMMMSTGSVSADGKTFNWSGECDDPMAGKRVKMRSVNKITDAGYIMEMYSPGPDGKEVKNGEITFTRTGGAAKPAKPAEPAKPAAPGNTAPAGGKK